MHHGRFMNLILKNPYLEFFEAGVVRRTVIDVAHKLILIIFLFIFASTENAQAEAKKAAKRATVDFTDQLVEGQAQKPELFYLLQQRNANNKRLIRLRDNFLPEMRRTAEDVGRSQSSKGSAR
jgi:hypothetical protein